MNINKSWPIRNMQVNQNSSIVTKAYKNDTENFKKVLSQNTSSAVNSSNGTRVDKIEISSASLPQNVSSSFDISKLKEKILSDISKETSQEKINEVSNKIEADSYDVNSSEIAKLILKI